MRATPWMRFAGIAALALGFQTGPAWAGTPALDQAVVTRHGDSYRLTWPGAQRVDVFAQATPTTPTGTAQPRLTQVASPATVTGLAPADARWYFVLKPASSPAAVVATRQFQLQGAHNVRDMGGFVTRDGRVTAWGKVFRGDSLGKLTPRDEHALASADVATVVSYLGPSEVARGGADRLPAGTREVSLPVLDPLTQALADSLQAALHSGDRATLEAMLGDGKSIRIGDEGFMAQLDQPKTMAAYGQTLRLIADDRGALLYHCSAGKDRTGMMSALLLGILGVPDDAIVADFLASNTYNREHNARTYAWLRSKGIDVALIRPLLEQRASEIQPVLDAVHRRYGGWDAFAHQVLGLDAATVTRLRRRMLTNRAP